MEYITTFLLTLNIGSSILLFVSLIFVCKVLKGYYITLGYSKFNWIVCQIAAGYVVLVMFFYLIYNVDCSIVSAMYLPIGVILIFFVLNWRARFQIELIEIRSLTSTVVILLFFSVFLTIYVVSVALYFNIIDIFSIIIMVLEVLEKLSFGFAFYQHTINIHSSKLRPFIPLESLASILMFIGAVLDPVVFIYRGVYLYLPIIDSLIFYTSILIMFLTFLFRKSILILPQEE